MATLETKFRGVKHITGRDRDVAKIANALYKRRLSAAKALDPVEDAELIEEIEKDALAKANQVFAFDKRSYKNINLRNNYTGIRRGIGTRFEQARNTYGKFVKRAVITPSPLPSNFGEQFIASLGGEPSSYTPLSAEEAAQQAYELNTPIARRKHDARMIEARAIGRGEVGGIAMANRLAEAQVHEARLKAARDEAQRFGEQQARAREKEKTGFQRIPDIQGITPIESKQSSRYNKQASKNTAAGIREAFGGKDLKFLRAMFWTGTGARMIRSFIAMNLQAAQGAAATSYTASAVGSDFRTLRSMGNVARIFGGNEKDAASLLAMLNKHTSGALIGAGLGPLGVAAMRYGLDVTGSGLGGLATPKEILVRIADLLKSYENMPGMVAMIASDIGLSPAMLEAMKEGGDIFEKKLSEQNTISDRQLDRLKESAQAQGELANSWQTLKETFAIELTPAIRAIAKKFAGFSEDRQALNDIEDVINQVRDETANRYNLTGFSRKRLNWWELGRMPDSAFKRAMDVFEERGLSAVDVAQRLSHHTFQDPDKAKLRFWEQYQRLYPEYLKGPQTYYTPNMFLPLQNFSPGKPTLDIDFNFGDLKLTPAQMEEGRKMFGTWLENSIVPTWGL